MKDKMTFAMKYYWSKIEYNLLLDRVKNNTFDKMLDIVNQDDLIATKEAEIKKLRKQIRYYKNKLKEK